MADEKDQDRRIYRETATSVEEIDRDEEERAERDSDNTTEDEKPDRFIRIEE